MAGWGWTLFGVSSTILYVGGGLSCSGRVSGACAECGGGRRPGPSPSVRPGRDAQPPPPVLLLFRRPRESQPSSRRRKRRTGRTAPPPHDAPADATPADSFLCLLQLACWMPPWRGNKAPPWRAVMEATLRFHMCLWLMPAWIPLLLPNGVAWGAKLGPGTESATGGPPCPGRMTWAVHLSGLEGSHPSEEELDWQADRLAKEAGLVNMGRVGELRGHYLLGYQVAGQGVDQGLEAIQQSVEAVLAQHGRVRWHAEQRLLKRSKRSLIFNDPKYPQQWHLNNRKSPGMDINVTGVWERNVTGQGVTVVVVDDGVEHTIEDIQPNYSPEGSYDLNSNDPDPMPHPDEENGNHHGTRCAGEIAAVSNNSFCAVGVAYGSRIAGIRVLDGPLTDSMEAVAFNKHYQINDIYSCSWGPDDDGKTVDGPHQLGKAALQHGVMAGRRGFGSIFVVASGNGGHHNDNCNYDGYANSIYTVTIGAVDEMGYMPFYAEECASMLAVTFSGGDKLMRSIATTDWDLQRGTGCTEGHTGTSAAAPLAAGMIALMLQVRPCLTWRDVQHLIVFTATKYEDHRASWDTNSAGLSHSHQHGFGLLNAWRLVNAAKGGRRQHIFLMANAPYCPYGQLGARMAVVGAWCGVHVFLFPPLSVTEADLDLSGMRTLEHVAVMVTITHPRRGNLDIRLVCPSGMKSLIGTPRSMDSDPGGFVDWTFSTVRCWGEEAQGIYRLWIRDVGDEVLRAGVLKQWQLTLYGSAWAPSEIKGRQRLLEEAMSGRYLDSSFSLPCPPGLQIPEEEVYTITTNTLKTLMLLGCFAVFWTFYYMLEVFLTRHHSRALDLGACRGSPPCRWYAEGRTATSLEDGIEMEETLPLYGRKEVETETQQLLPCQDGPEEDEEDKDLLSTGGIEGLAQEQFTEPSAAGAVYLTHGLLTADQELQAC
ncbi:proprotein convertase subtilisin/kexin type 7 [Sceloporus undulatus]|uniref:proprotein convertase subtilisin/kexin type 7 n=1 Tax=Sceloporus undulatus TaxID=8520 RepID=UPI001C4DA975|nr:proprotein convertase subtilisin/kexin type 7 [Sceloporus undulatus]